MVMDRIQREMMMIKPRKILNYVLRMGLFALSLHLMGILFMLSMPYILPTINSDTVYYAILFTPLIVLVLLTWLVVRSCYRYEQTLDTNYSWKTRKTWVGF